jgi:hypothetical protein
MEDLEIKDLQQLVLFYKNKSVELEMAFLLEQIKYKNMVIEKDKDKKDSMAEQLENITNGQIDNLQKLTIKNEMLVKELEKYKKTNVSNKKQK